MSSASQQVADSVRRAVQRALDPKEAERMARQGLGAVKRRARRQDPIGELTYRSLSVVHQGLSTAVHGLERLIEVSEPPARPGGRGKSKKTAIAKPDK
jgi:hypothetical protein